MESILTSIKKLLGITEEYTHFDTDIIMHINTAFMTLRQLGVGPPEGFRIEDKDDEKKNYLVLSASRSVEQMRFDAACMLNCSKKVARNKRR